MADQTATVQTNIVNKASCSTIHHESGRNTSGALRLMQPTARSIRPKSQRSRARKISADRKPTKWTLPDLTKDTPSLCRLESERIRTWARASAGGQPKCGRCDTSGCSNWLSVVTGCTSSTLLALVGGCLPASIRSPFFPQQAIVPAMRSR